MCFPKDVGGLGVRDIVKWNQATLGRYVGNCCKEGRTIYELDGCMRFMSKKKSGGCMFPPKDVAGNGR